MPRSSTCLGCRSRSQSFDSLRSLRRSGFSKWQPLTDNVPACRSGFGTQAGVGGFGIYKSLTAKAIPNWRRQEGKDFFGSKTARGIIVGTSGCAASANLRFVQPAVSLVQICCSVNLNRYTSTATILPLLRKSAPLAASDPRLVRVHQSPVPQQRGRH